jgi:hypothetical protein
MEIVDGVPDDYLEASHKYVARKEWDGFEAQVRGLYRRMARISITPEWAKLLIGFGILVLLAALGVI